MPRRVYQTQQRHRYGGWEETLRPYVPAVMRVARGVNTVMHSPLGRRIYRIATSPVYIGAAALAALYARRRRAARTAERERLARLARIQEEADIQEEVAAELARRAASGKRVIKKY